MERPTRDSLPPTPHLWLVLRWSGRSTNQTRVDFEGDEEAARAHYASIAVTLTPGGVYLYTPDNRLDSSFEII